MNSCVFIGTGAGEANFTGTSNTFIGSSAGKHINSNNNTFIGSNAGILTTTGYHNTFIGQGVAKLNVTGYNNTFIGRETGASIVSGSGNVFIGNEAGRNETGSNLLYISNSNTSTPLIWGNFSGGQVGIARVATTNTLEVGGNASKTTAGDWLANSDARLKKNVQALDEVTVLQKLLSMKGIT